MPVSFGGESEGTPGSLSCQKYGLILVWSGSGPQILSGLSSPAKSLKIDARLDLLEEFTSKLVITPDSEEGGVITPDVTTPVKGLK